MGEAKVQNTEDAAKPADVTDKTAKPEEESAKEDKKPVAGTDGKDESAAEAPSAKDAAEAAQAPSEKAAAAKTPELTEEEKQAEREKLIAQNKRRLRLTLNLLLAFVFAIGALIVTLSSLSAKVSLGVLGTGLCFILSIPLALLGVYVGRLVKDWAEPMGEDGVVETFSLKLILQIVWPYVFFFLLVTVLTILPYLILGRGPAPPAP